MEIASLYMARFLGYPAPMQDEIEFISGLLRFVRGATVFTSSCGLIATIASLRHGSTAQTVLYCAGTAVLFAFALLAHLQLRRLRARSE